MSNIINFLQQREFIDQVTAKDLDQYVKDPIGLYVGFDPTADSLHLGHLVGIIALKWFQQFGHKAHALIGGATGRIGDPSGKSKERPFLTDAFLNANVNSISNFLKKMLGNEIIILNNDEWFKDYPFVDFLRDIGKHFRMGPMLSKESVKVRMESEEGMSFTEFSYQILQAYDFYYLFKHKNISMQLGGSDQWGNIVAGIDLIRKLSQKPAYGMTFPLITRSDGKKFGKSEEGAIWLSEERLSPYQFYQYLFQIPDSDVIRLMKMLTFMDLKDIKDIENEMKSTNYVPNSAQKRLAEEITFFVHGKEGLDIALKVTKGASPGKEADLSKEVLEEIAKDMPNANLIYDEVIDAKYVDIATKINLTSSKSEAVRLIKNGGAYLNNNKIQDVNFSISQKDIIGETYLLLGAGKKKKIVVTLVPK